MWLLALAAGLRARSCARLCDPERQLGAAASSLDRLLAQSPVPIKVHVVDSVATRWNLDEGFHALATHLAQDSGVLQQGGVFILYSVSEEAIDVRAAEPTVETALRGAAEDALRRPTPALVVETLLHSAEELTLQPVAVDQSNTLLYTVSFAAGMVALMVAACCAYDMVCAWRHRAQYRSCRSKIKLIHSVFQCDDLPLCPICIEPLGDGVKACPHNLVFLCGHRFHTDCANSWLAVNDAPGRCPICALPNTYSHRESTGEPRDEIKAFFLTSLRLRFPEFISREQRDQWRDCHTETWLAELRPQRYTSIWSSWRRPG